MYLEHFIFRWLMDLFKGIMASKILLSDFQIQRNKTLPLKLLLFWSIAILTVFLRLDRQIIQSLYSLYVKSEMERDIIIFLIFLLEQGPGASDDAASCAVMLEIIHVMFQTKYLNREMQRDIIFLFNGAEEVILAASHGFITKVD